MKTIDVRSYFIGFLNGCESILWSYYKSSFPGRYRQKVKINNGNYHYICQILQTCNIHKNFTCNPKKYHLHFMQFNLNGG